MEKIAIVTGATRGIGKAIAKKFLKAGIKTAICGRDPQLLDGLWSSEVLAIQADVSVPDDVERLVKEVLAKWGRIDIVVNNAGITRDNLLVRMNDEQWDNVIDTNLSGAFYVCRAVMRPMLKQRFGRIVNISSVVGVSGNPGQVNYSAAKAGLIGLTKSLAKEVAGRGILVNAVAPGYIDTDLTRALNEHQQQEVMRRIPVGRLGQVEDVAETVYFLVSDVNQYITGQTIHVDGGLVI